MINKLLTYLFKNKIKIILLNKEEEFGIIQEMSRIVGIRNYFILQEQGGYQMFAKTEDKRYLGYSDFAKAMLHLFDEVNQPKEKEIESNGYESQT